MAMVSMKKIRMYIDRSEGGAVLDIVHKLGLVEFHEIDPKLDLKKEENNSFEFNRASSRLDFAVNFLSKYEEKKGGGLKRMIEGDKISAKNHQIEALASKYDFNTLVDELVSVEERLNIVNASIKDLEKEISLLSDWSFLKIPLNKFETKKTEITLLRGIHESEVLLEDKLKEKGILYHIESNGFHHAVATFIEEKEHVLEIAARVHFEVVNLPVNEMTPSEYIYVLKKKLKDEIVSLAVLNNSIKEHVKELPRLKVMSDLMSWKKERHDLLTSGSRTEKVLVFEGWCPTKKVELLNAEISKTTRMFDLEIIDAKENEEPPVEIHNKGVVKAFEAVTRLYGLPSHKDIDPTVFFSGFFFVFFGLCLTDVGYGIFLSLLLGFILLRYKVPKDSKPLITLLFLGGIASAVVGLFFGGYLGIDIKFFPEWIQNLQKFDPIKSPMPVLALSLMLGVAHIMFGIFLKIVSEAKNGTLMDGILDQVPWLMFFFSLIGFGLARMDMLFGIHGHVLVYAIIGSAVLIMLTQSRKGDTFFGKIFKGVMSLYDSVAYFSDILSYSRILALGLATSALAFAVNLIAVLVRDMIPVVGPIVMVLILIVGHIFNMIVNILGAFIHSARLQFVEFFSKFIAGSGRQFQPFARKEVYVTVEED